MNIKELIDRCIEADELIKPGTALSIHPNTLGLSDIANVLSHELPIAGVTRLASITGFSDLPWPVWISIRPNAKALSQSSGKSTTHVSALIGAAMEGIELSKAEEYEPLDSIIFSYEEAKKKNCIDLSKSPIPTDLFSSTTPIKWVPSLRLDKSGLNADKGCLVPVNLVKLDFRREKLDLRFANSSNGLASGFTRNEAISQALLECVERHSSTFTNIFGLGKKVEITRVPKRCQIMLKDLSKLGFCATILDCSVFDGLPVFECKLTPNKPSAKYTGGMGWGCHPNPEIALMRSILEANQARTIIISGSRDDMHKNIYLRERVRHKTEDYDRMVHNRLKESQLSFNTGASYSTLADCLSKTMETLSDNGFDEVYVIPLTPIEQPVQVVKVIVPGFEGYHSATYKPINSLNYRNGPFLMTQRLNQHSRMGAVRLNAGGVNQ